MIADWMIEKVFEFLAWVSHLVPIPGVPDWVGSIPALLIPTLHTMGKLCSWVPWSMAGTVVASVIVVWSACLVMRVAWSIAQILGEWVPTGG